MNCDRKDLMLYAVTDRSWLGGETLRSQVERALKGGATFIQLREKELNEGDFLEEAKEIQKLCREYHVPFVINDNVEIAAAIGADGVHVGQSDMEAGDVRRRLGPDKIIGVSAQTAEQALRAQEHGADYLGVGAVFPTGSKADATEVSRETLEEICRAVDIPVIAIGGIGRENVMELKGSGICGIAVISAIFAQKDIEAAAAELKKRVEEMLA
ncbi:MAG TPA: thiamine phosphate synthase [Candidatus Mediterraneibacter faecigallinarum]|uniref:Thiamine-phosphate synthase n=1 Tax=Candidatus Mediterraneibacter faecigallinarum TaxID=2838669 RepID=A0A9D2NY00_9FIRM|nr:thiamine phosphate synthase [Candidatus Mediterraneibacter faecigallinarum]